MQKASRNTASSSFCFEVGTSVMQLLELETSASKNHNSHTVLNSDDISTLLRNGLFTTQQSILKFWHRQTVFVSLGWSKGPNGALWVGGRCLLKDRGIIHSVKNDDHEQKTAEEQCAD